MIGSVQSKTVTYQPSRNRREAIATPIPELAPVPSAWPRCWLAWFIIRIRGGATEQVGGEQPPGTRRQLANKYPMAALGGRSRHQTCGFDRGLNFDQFLF